MKRYPLSLGSLVVALLAGGSPPALFVLAQSSPAAQPPGPVFPVPARDPDRPKAEEMFAAVDPTVDRWAGEVVTEKLDEQFKYLADAMRKREATAILKLLHSEFRGPSLAPQSSARVPAPRDVELVKGRFDNSSGSLNRGAFSQALLAWLQPFGSFDVVSFKIVNIEVDAPRAEGAASARARILYDFTGKDDRGELVSRQGWWRTEWVRAHTWVMKALEIESSISGRARKSFFTDVSAAALGGASSYWDQMRPGINHFRASMDAASGIDVYGHNGVAVADVDGDGLEDLFVAQPQGLPNRLYRNRGDGTFGDISREAGVDLLERTSIGLFGDVDNDGDQDLFVIIQNWTPVLFLNDGRGKFTLSPKARFERKDGVNATLSSASLADYDNDGYLDLYVTSYRYIDAPGEDTQLALPYPYHDASNGPPNVLFRNRGDGTFEDMTRDAGLDAGNNRFSFASAWGDFNADGLLDFYVANDFGRNNLYENLGKGKFREVTQEAGVEDIGAGMSVAWTDVDADGLDDLYVGNMWSSAGQRLTGQPGYQSQQVLANYVRHAKGNSLFRNRGDGRFDDVSTRAGVEFGRWAWSSDFGDFDNDGDNDLYIANGFITNDSSKDL